MRPPVYLDCASTTPVDPRVTEEMMRVLSGAGQFGNPGSASHEYGETASALIEAARAQVAGAVGAEAVEVIWTSGATEADNLAIFGLAHHAADRGRHIITARTEHKAVLDPCRALERRGWRVTYLVPDAQGIVDPGQVAAAMTAQTVLVSIMHVNNEIGVIQDIAGMAAVCERHGRARLHVDAAQSVGKCPLDFAATGADLMSLSAHKAYGPKGVGALLVSRRRGVRIGALLVGGGQERGLRSGTVATHQVVGMGTAFALAAAAVETEAHRIGGLQERLWQGLAAIGGVLRNGSPAVCVPQILNVSFAGIEGESLLLAVKRRIAVSTGSACTSAANEPSYVLRALGRDEQLAESSLRFGLGRFTSEEDIDQALAAVREAVAHLRRIGGAGSGTAAHALQ